MDLQNEGGRLLSLELPELKADCRAFGRGVIHSYLERGIDTYFCQDIIK